MSIFDGSQSPEPVIAEHGRQSVVWTSQRRQLLAWFRREAPSLAPAYDAAVQIAYMPSMPAKVHLVCHVVRDIYSKLPEILDGEYRRTNSGEMYRSFVERIEAHWANANRPLLAVGASPATGTHTADEVSISAAAARSVDRLLERHRALKKEPRSAEVLARALYRRFAESGLDAPGRLVGAFEAERVWFTKRAHLVREKEKLPCDDGLVEHFTSFERALYSLVGKYFTGKKEIDAILEQANR